MLVDGPMKTQSTQDLPKSFHTASLQLKVQITLPSWVVLADHEASRPFLARMGRFEALGVRR